MKFRYAILNEKMRINPKVQSIYFLIEKIVEKWSQFRLMDFSTLNSPMQHDLLKSTIRNLVHNDFRKKYESENIPISKLQDKKGI